MFSISLRVVVSNVSSLFSLNTRSSRFRNAQSDVDRSPRGAEAQVALIRRRAVALLRLEQRKTAGDDLAVVELSARAREQVPFVDLLAVVIFDAARRVPVGFPVAEAEERRAEIVVDAA